MADRSTVSSDSVSAGAASVLKNSLNRCGAKAVQRVSYSECCDARGCNKALIFRALVISVLFECGEELLDFDLGQMLSDPIDLVALSAL